MRIMACLLALCAACVADAGEGDVHLTRATDLRGIPTSTPGSVYLYDDWSTGATSDVSVAKLASIGGDLFVQPRGGVTVLRFPDLREVEGTIWIEGASTLERVELPVLVRAKGLVARANPKLRELHVDALAEASALNIALNPELTNADFPALEGPTQISVIGNHVLRELRLPRLEEAFDFTIHANSSIEELRFDRLRSTHRLDIEELFAVQSVEFPALEVARLVSFRTLPRLRELRLPSVREVWQLNVSDVDLTVLEAPSLRTGTVFYLTRNPPSLRRVDFRSYDCASELGFDVWAPRCLLERGLPQCDLDATGWTWPILDQCVCIDGAGGVEVDCSGEVVEGGGR